MKINGTKNSIEVKYSIQKLILKIHTFLKNREINSTYKYYTCNN